MYLLPFTHRKQGSEVLGHAFHFLQLFSIYILGSSLSVPVYQLTSGNLAGQDTWVGWGEPQKPECYQEALLPWQMAQAEACVVEAGKRQTEPLCGGDVCLQSLHSDGSSLGHRETLPKLLRDPGPGHMTVMFLPRLPLYVPCALGFAFYLFDQKRCVRAFLHVSTD